MSDMNFEYVEEVGSQTHLKRVILFNPRTTWGGVNSHPLPNIQMHVRTVFVHIIKVKRYTSYFSFTSEYNRAFLPNIM